MSPSASDPDERPEPPGVSDALGELLLGIDHVGIAVPDLESAIELYTGVLGFGLQLQETNEEQGVREAMLTPPGWSEGSTAGRVQLLCPLAPDSTIGRFLERSGPGLQQLALRVRDVDRAAARLGAAGLRVLYPRPRPGTDHSMINFVHPKDTGGVLIELVQPAGL